MNGYLLDENFRLFASSRFGNQPGFLFYFQILAAGLLPWTGLLIGRLVDDVRAIRRGESLDGLEVMLWSWTAAVVGFFTLSTFKLDHYVFPAAPALCLLCARAWVDVRADQMAAAPSRRADRPLPDRTDSGRRRRRLRLLPDRASPAAAVRGHRADRAGAVGRARWPR